MRHFRINSAWIAASLVWIGITATSARADVIYNYKGNPLSVCSFGTCPSDYIIASLSFTNPLGPNLSGEDVSGALTSWSISDTLGLLNFSSSDPNSNLVGPLLSTNSSGDITEWIMEGFSATAGFLFISNPPFNGAADSIQVGPDDDADWGATNENPGQWSRVSQVPEPSTYALVGLGGAVLAVVKRKQGIKPAA